MRSYVGLAAMGRAADDGVDRVKETGALLDRPPRFDCRSSTRSMPPTKMLLEPLAQDPLREWPEFASDE